MHLSLRQPYLYFNSRPRKEVDLLWRVPCLFEINISTHDLTKRSTRNIRSALGLRMFQLTTSRGGRRWVAWEGHMLQAFQLTTSRGDRHVEFPKSLFCRYFNSRPHEEVDLHLPPLPLYSIYFNSRPHKEIDISYCPRRSGLLLFQLTTSRRGRRQVIHLLSVSIQISTHDLTKRSTRKHDSF